MNKKIIAAISVIVLAVVVNVPSSYAVDKVAEPNPVISGVASGVLPPMGQVINKEGKKPKSFIMAAIEVTSITALVLTATLVGGPIVWVGIGPLMANHIWSGTEAYATAARKDKEAKEASAGTTVQAQKISAPAAAAPLTDEDKKKQQESQSAVK